MPQPARPLPVSLSLCALAMLACGAGETPTPAAPDPVAPAPVVPAPAAPVEAPAPPVPASPGAPTVDLAAWWKALPPCVREAILNEQHGREPLDADGIARMATVRAIRIYPQCATPVKDLTWVAPLSSLEQLMMNEQPVTDLSPLSATQALTSLELYNRTLASWPATLTLPVLKRLSIRSPAFASVAGLERQTALTDLALFGCPVTRITSLATLTNLTSLNLAQTRIDSLDALKGMTHLQKLQLSYLPTPTPLILAPIHGLPLVELSLERTSVEGFAGLAGIQTLRRLDISQSNVDSLDPILALQLDELRALDTQIPEESIERWKSAHPIAEVTTYEEPGD